jgi:hypothetical protein
MAVAARTRHALQLRLRGRGAAGSMLHLTVQFVHDSGATRRRREAATVAAATAADCDAPMPPASAFAPFCEFTLS